MEAKCIIQIVSFAGIPTLPTFNRVQSDINLFLTCSAYCTVNLYNGWVATKNEISGKLVSEYETFFKEPAEPNLLELVLQMEGSVLRIERPYGQNSNKLILYGIEDDPEPAPAPVPTVATNGTSPGRPNIKYPYTCESQ